MPMVGFLFFPWIAAFFGGLVSDVAAYFVKSIAKRAAMAAALIALTFSFGFAVNQIVGAIQVSMPLVIQKGIDLLPSNTNPCITAYFSNYVFAWVYHHQKNLIFNSN